MPKSYWTIEKAKGENSKPTSLNAKAVTGSNLADDEFVSVCLPNELAAGTTVPPSYGLIYSHR
ncbi:MULTISPECIES: hypothetical protein [Rhizobium]|uniref:hypothetical protein n=1 Tax=Rhizobium TaxID=379 RepID=UPI00042A287C|nr:MULTISPECIES: hypothetical protein [Rhizobium]MCA0806295.1 YcnI family protein [Rhizobium sp. T1473]MCS0463610.1 YcnI family protein [Rhizobium favelukesii]UFS84882.1 YcnI family protein [Rhizobium sp. T136]